MLLLCSSLVDVVEIKLKVSIGFYVIIVIGHVFVFRIMKIDMCSYLADIYLPKVNK